MGLAEVPEIAKQVEVMSREILREVLIERLARNVTPDPATVERLFRDSVREWKTSSLLFQDEAAAERARKELAGGAASFATVSARLVAAKTATAGGDTTYHSKQDYLPQIAAAIAPLKVGQVSPVVRLPAGFAVLKVTSVRYPENPDARAAARAQALSQRQIAFMTAHERDLRRQYVVINKTLLNGIDYEAVNPSVDVLLKDARVVAEIKGGPSVTVGDLTDYLRMQYFHGSDQAAQRRRMNEKKADALDATLSRRLLNMEAAKLGIDKTAAYRDRVTGYADSLVFGNFVQKVIAPGSRVTEDEVTQYYNAHIKEYSYPGMVRVQGLAFARRSAAEDAIQKAKTGTDFRWLAANATGRVPEGSAGLLAFDGRPVTTDSMPDGLQKLLAGAKSGDFKLYASPEGHFYALEVQQVVASTAKPYSEVREAVAQKAFAEKIQKGVDDYASKLRAKTKVATYLQGARQ